MLSVVALQATAASLLMFCLYVPQFSNILQLKLKAAARGLLQEEGHFIKGSVPGLI